MLAQLSIGAKQVLELSSRLTGGGDDEDEPLVGYYLNALKEIN